MKGPAQMPERQKIAAGNWKMFGTAADLGEVAAIADGARTMAGIATVLCLPATLIHRAVQDGIALGGQDCHTAAQGAHTGDVAAGMLADAGATHVIVGHSERRSDHAETDAVVAAKAQAAWRANLTAVICIGETREVYAVRWEELKRPIDRLMERVNGIAQPIEELVTRLTANNKA